MSDSIPTDAALSKERADLIKKLKSVQTLVEENCELSKRVHTSFKELLRQMIPAPMVWREIGRNNAECKCGALRFSYRDSRLYVSYKGYAIEQIGSDYSMDDAKRVARRWRDEMICSIFPEMDLTAVLALVLDYKKGDKICQIGQKIR